MLADDLTLPLLLHLSPASQLTFDTAVGAPVDAAAAATATVTARLIIDATLSGSEIRGSVNLPGALLRVPSRSTSQFVHQRERNFGPPSGVACPLGSAAPTPEATPAPLETSSPSATPKSAPALQTWAASNAGSVVNGRSTTPPAKATSSHSVATTMTGSSANETSSTCFFTRHSAVAYHASSCKDQPPCAQGSTLGR